MKTTLNKFFADGKTSTLADFIGRIKIRQAKISESLTNGVPGNFEVYQRLVGQHQGLDEALNVLNQLLEQCQDLNQR
jgi:hypothetical protein